ncbi:MULTISPECIES: hypothetical protein [Streptomyces]|uniref:Uncharacterized protein n=1 Tax=Streptomyces avermitilis TaxID=33903 RepID=A0A4D4LHS1_STRAX|nr:hypothetical protein [Streptomyces avermitilis]MYS96809.1 hypothetical protein [Streptomyces sp. SID5469]BBJ48820.1 hypothetical protein SAVMC3_14490 [Streptomyces avermitilis]GDY60862.1 hypothetical protein SAV14893_002550 [Streptomyces avermitilis]GDY79060.1 hypothetical protein SAV31267_085450 [Streptomyces avermitilis]GDY88099.1 hypothetical protein SAVCW2_72980 [Streptomyces avermitilis]
MLVGGGAEWHVVYRFGCGGSARDWDASVTGIQWSARADELAREAGDRIVHGSTAWFDSGTVTPAAPRPPPKWKLRFVDVSTVFPPVLLFNLAVLPCLGSLNSLIRTPSLQAFLAGPNGGLRKAENEQREVGG